MSVRLQAGGQLLGGRRPVAALALWRLSKSLRFHLIRGFFSSWDTMRGVTKMKTRIRSRIIVVCLVAFVVATIIGVKLSARSSSKDVAVQKVVSGENRLVVHEWGTFTSIAGKDGI